MAQELFANFRTDQSNILTNITEEVTVPSDAPLGDTVIRASLMSLYGAGKEPTFSNYNVSVTFGDHTSTNYVSSSEF